ncbi:MAG: indole-3-glycerol phosphate synthase TrpC [Dehalococcoidia bacterium]|nr:indole-3-glycerol phosphate synthase TrpC [Dehalococcoidia bacterium]
MILDKIVAATKKSLPERKARMPLADLEAIACAVEPPRDFAGAIGGSGIKLIAEVKRASPSKGPLALNLNAPTLARSYEKGGAAAISVLTETEYFKGSMADLEAVRSAVDIPILRKDFIIDPYQVFEARAGGADIVLLIAAILSSEEMRGLLEIVHSLEMKALVEVHDRAELERVLKLNPEVIGINNRNLFDFSVTLQTTLALRPFVPKDVLLVSESGIHIRDDVRMLEDAGVNAILVGEALVTSADPAAKIRELIG